MAGKYNGAAYLAVGREPLSGGEKIPSEIWHSWTIEDRVTYLTHKSLEQCRDILEIPVDEALAGNRAPTIMSAKVQVVRAMILAAVKIGLAEDRLRAERDRILGELTGATATILGEASSEE